MKDISTAQILIGACSSLMGMVSFIGIFLLKRMTTAVDLLTKIDKDQAVMAVTVERNEKDISGLKDADVDLAKSINEVGKDNDKQDLSLFKLNSEIKGINNKLRTNQKGE